MNTNTQTGRLEVLRHSLEAARDTSIGKEHQSLGLSDEFQKRYEYHMRGMTAGIQLAIDAIDSELRIIAAGEQAAHQ